MSYIWGVFVYRFVPGISELLGLIISGDRRLFPTFSQASGTVPRCNISWMWLYRVGHRASRERLMSHTGMPGLRLHADVQAFCPTQCNHATYLNKRLCVRSIQHTAGFGAALPPAEASSIVTSFILKREIYVKEISQTARFVL